MASPRGQEEAGRPGLGDQRPQDPGRAGHRDHRPRPRLRPHLPRLFPHAPDAKHWFNAPEVEQITAFRNGSLQGAYLIIAARALGLDVGPMSGFDNAGVDEAFFAGTRVKSNFICTLGHGTEENLFAAQPAPGV